MTDSHASSSHEQSLEPTSTKIEDLVNTVFVLSSRKTEIARSVRGPNKVLSENCESRNNYRHAIVAQDFGHPMDPVISVQNKNFPGNTKELAKVLGARLET